MLRSQSSVRHRTFFTVKTFPSLATVTLAGHRITCFPTYTFTQLLTAPTKCPNWTIYKSRKLLNEKHF